MNAKLFLGRLVCLIVGHAKVGTIEAFLGGKSALKLGAFFVPENNVTFEGEEFRYVVSVFCCARCRLHFVTEGQTIPKLNGEAGGGRDVKEWGPLDIQGCPRGNYLLGTAQGWDNTVTHGERAKEFLLLKAPYWTRAHGPYPFPPRSLPTWKRAHHEDC